MKYRKIFFLLFIFILALQFSLVSKEDTVKNSHILILKDGNEYKGTLVKIDDNNITFEIDGVNKTWPKAEIDRIQFHKTRLYEDAKYENDINDEEISILCATSKKWQPSYENQTVILLDKLTYNFDQNNKVTIDIKKAIKILNEEGKETSTQYFYYLKEISNAELLYGITIQPDGSVKSIDESAINDEPINNKVPHYNKLHRIKFGLKDVDVGSVIVWEAKIVRSWNNLQNPIFIEKELVSYENIEKQIIRIASPENLKISYQIYDGLIEYKKPEIKEYKENGKNIIYLEQNNVASYTNDEQNTPTDSVIYPKFYASPNINWNELSKSYYENYINKPVSIDIEKKATEIVGNEKNKLNQIKDIYNYINRKISLIDIPMQSFQFTPLTDDKLATVSSLNTLDKSFLFYKMSRTLGIPVKLFLYRNNNKNEIISTSPSLSQFDSVICEAKAGFKPIYVSFEDPDFAIGQTFYSTSDASALELTSSSGIISKLQKISFKENTSEYTYNCLLDEDNSLTIDKTTTIFGSDQVFWRNKRLLSKEELDKYMEKMASSLGSDVSVENYQFKNKLDEFEKPVILNQKIKVINYAFSSGKNVKLFKIPEIRFGASSVGKSERALPYRVGETSLNKYKINIVIPKNYTVKYMPLSLNSNYDGFSLKANYNVKGNKIEINIETAYTKDEIPPSQYQDFKKWNELKAKLTDEWIILEAVK